MADADGFLPVEGSDGNLRKKILVEGQGDDKPTAGDKVQVHYTGTITADGSKFDSSRDREGCFDFQLGVGQVIKAWDVGVATMKQGEKCILRCTSEYGYGAQGSPPKIPPDAGLDFEVELLDWSEGSKEPWQLSIEEKLTQGEAKRVEGNTKFKAQDYIARLKADVEMYLAVKGQKAEVSKARFRRAQANLRRGELELAKEDFEAMLLEEPEHKEAQAELRRLLLAQAKARKVEKAIYSKMFA